MPNKYISVPEAVVLHDPDDEAKPIENAPPWDFFTFVRKVLLADERWRKDYDAVMSSTNIRAAMKDQAVKPYLSLDSRDWERLRDCVRTPTNGFGYHQALLPQLGKFLTAIVDAADKPPKTANGAEEAKQKGKQPPQPQVE